MVRKLVTSLFLLLLCGVPIAQAAWELARGGHVQALDIFGRVNAERLRTFEDDLRAASFLHRSVTPHYQLALSRLFRRGNEKVTFGRDGWLYYAEDLDLVTGPTIEVEGPGPLDAIADFRDQLAERGVELLFVPVPAKTMVVPDRQSWITAGLDSVANPGTRAFFTALAQRGVRTVDLASILAELRSSDEEPYLARDTHWTPRAMELAAARTALAAQPILGLDLIEAVEWTATPVAVRGAGDIADMLRLPAGTALFDEMELTVHRVTDAASGMAFEPDESAEVLLLGDSFTRVFSDGALGFGESAGFGEHLARELGARLDVIAISGGSARAVREAVARRANGLSGKRLVVWQISMRDLVGEPEQWARVALPVTSDSPGPDPGGPRSELSVRAEIVAVSRVPADFEYAFCLVVHRYEVLEVLSGELAPGPLWVAHVALDDFEATPDGSLNVGDKLRMTLEDVDDHYDLEDTSWIDDTDSGFDIWFPTVLEQDG